MEEESRSAGIIVSPCIGKSCDVASAGCYILPSLGSSRPVTGVFLYVEAALGPARQAGLRIDAAQDLHQPLPTSPNAQSELVGLSSAEGECQRSAVGGPRRWESVVRPHGAG